MSRAICKNLRDFFINYVRNSALAAIAYSGIPACDHRISGAEGIVCGLHHGDIVLRIAYADQDLSAQLLLQKLGRQALGHTLGLHINDPGCGTGGIHLITPKLVDPGFDPVDLCQLLRGAFVQTAHRVGGGIVKQGELDKRTQIRAGLGKTIIPDRKSVV